MYTDGAALGNPGPGGYAVIMRYKQHQKEIAKGFRLTTNNRMELMAVIEGLRQLKKPSQWVTVYTDSRYVVDAIEKGWLTKWQGRNFRQVANADLWQQLIPLLQLHHVHFIWVKGHAGHPENERCDQLASTAARCAAEHIDEVYEAQRQQSQHNKPA